MKKATITDAMADVALATTTAIAAETQNLEEKGSVLSSVIADFPMNFPVGYLAPLTSNERFFKGQSTHPYRKCKEKNPRMIEKASVKRKTRNKIARKSRKTSRK